MLLWTTFIIVSMVFYSPNGKDVSTKQVFSWKQECIIYGINDFLIKCVYKSVIILIKFSSYAFAYYITLLNILLLYL